MTIQAPFTDGLVTDVPAHLLGPRMASQAENVIVIDGIARRRRGWMWTPGGEYAAWQPITGIRSAEFALAGTTRRVFTTQEGAFDELTFNGTYRHLQVHGHTAGAGTLVDVIPRCVYRDEVILCSQNGQRGIIRYAGAGWMELADSSWEQSETQINASGSSDRPTVAMSSTAGQTTFTYTLPVGNPAGLATLTDLVDGAGNGWFLNWDGNSAPIFAAKLAGVSGTDTGVLLQAIATGGSWSQINANVLTFGTAYPAVSVYGAGSATISSNTATGVGTEWLNGDWGSVDVGPGGGDNSGRGSILISDGSTYYHRAIQSVSSDTSLTTIAAPDIASASQYHITRSLPFKDACVWKRSLVGTGVVQYPNRVYICPPDWDLESPPGSVPPLRMEAASFNNTDANYFLVDFVDVPSTADTDKCVAVLPTPGPLLVLKEDSVHGLYGDFPSFSQSLIRRGAGCIDLRSAIDCKWGQFWAGREGIYWFTPERGVVDITQGRINRTWRELVATYRGVSSTFRCVIGQNANKLLVAIGLSGSGVSLCFDIAEQRWDGYFTNHNAAAFDAPNDEESSLLWAGAPAQSGATRMRNSGRLLRGEGPIYDGGSTYVSGIAEGTTAFGSLQGIPAMSATTSTGLARHEGIDGLSKMVDVSVSGLCRGPDAAGAALKSSALISGGIDNETLATVANLPMIEPPSSGSERIQRVRSRVNRSGRSHAVKVETDASRSPAGDGSSEAFDVQVHQVTVSFRDSRERA